MDIIEKVIIDINEYLNDISRAKKVNNYTKIRYVDVYFRTKNKYKVFDGVKNKAGIYFFVNRGKVIYIGQSSLRTNKSSNWSMFDRLKQHFRERDRGSILNKISNCNLIKNERTYLVVVHIFNVDNGTKNRRVIMFLESYLIGKYRPKYNFVR